MSWLGLSFGKSEKALVGLAAVSLALSLLQPAFAFLQPVRQFALALLLILGGLFAMVRLVDLGRWLVRKLLWRVRHRMVAVFFFVGVLPISLGALLAAWGGSLLLGPFTAYAVLTEFREEVGRLESMARPLLWQAREAPAAQRRALLERFQADASHEFPGLVLRIESGGSRTAVSGEALRGAIPSNLREPGALVRTPEGLFLAAVVQGDPDEGRAVAAVPVTSELLRSMMPGLGVLEVDRDQADPGDGRAWPVSLAPAVAGGVPVAESGVPPPRHPLDWRIAWPIQSEIVDWEADRIDTAEYVLRTRLSALWTTVFETQPEWTYRLFVIVGFGLLAAFGANVLVSLVIATSLTRTLTRAVNELYVGTKHVHEGDFSYRIPVKGTDQVSDLSRSFNTMTRSIEHLIEESKRRQQLEAEIEIAREVQSRLFPAHAPLLADLEVLGVCRPARSVSGDFFDYVDLGNGRLAISFGDVSGKGISAALVMASLHSIVRAQLALLTTADAERLDRSAALLVERANLQLWEGTAPEKFSTLFFAAYEADSGTLAYSNAGHLPPLLLRAGSVSPLEVNGMIVGAFPQAEYSATNLSLERGDLLVAYTDGLTEPENAAGEEFGEERFQAALRRHAARPPSDLIEGIMNEVIEWTGDLTLQDDMTMLVVRRQ